MTGLGLGLPERGRVDVEALVADRYLDDLLSAADRRATDVPADAALHPELREAARILRRSLVRVHPSFRFEERLSARLAELAAVQSRPIGRATGGDPRIPPRFARPAGLPESATLAADPLLGAILAGELDPANEVAADIEGRPAAAHRPLLVGGAITSAAISLVGVAWVAWRATHADARSSAGALGWAARAVHGRRTEAAGLPGGGVGGPA